MKGKVRMDRAVIESGLNWAELDTSIFELRLFVNRVGSSLVRTYIIKLEFDLL